VVDTTALFSKHQTFGASARRDTQRAYRFTLQTPAYFTMDAIGRVEPSIGGSSSPSAGKTNRFDDRGRQNPLALADLVDIGASANASAFRR